MDFVGELAGHRIRCQELVDFADSEIESPGLRAYSPTVNRSRNRICPVPIAGDKGGTNRRGKDAAGTRAPKHRSRQLVTLPTARFGQSNWNVDGENDRSGNPGT